MQTTKLTPPRLADRWGVSTDKILSLVRSGELRAINVSEGRQRARYLIDLADVEEFERRRETRPLPVSASGRPKLTKRYV
jgi:excisionase family DNA binding protein